MPRNPSGRKISYSGYLPALRWDGTQWHLHQNLRGSMQRQARVVSEAEAEDLVRDALRDMITAEDIGGGLHYASGEFVGKLADIRGLLARWLELPEPADYEDRLDLKTAIAGCRSQIAVLELANRVGGWDQDDRAPMAISVMPELFLA